MAETLSAADISAVTRPYGYDGMGFGNNGIIWLFALLALGGGNFFGNRGNAATVEDLNTTSNFARLESQVQGIGSTIASGFRGVDNAVCQLGYQGLQNYANLSKELAGCCCENLRGLDSIKFDMANYAAATNATIVAESQKTRDLFTQSEIKNLQAQVNQLQLQNALCGVVRYPNTTTFTAGMNPFFNNSNIC